MNIDRQQLAEESAKTTFREEILEKVLLLMDLLESFSTHEFLKDRLVLKGGTALNLFYFDLPRLSVDIDLNYIGSLDRDIMREERKQIENIINLICTQKGYQIKKLPTGHSGGKIIIRYQSLLGNTANLQVDINYMFRQPLLPAQKCKSIILADKNIEFLVLDIHELAAGKLAALFSRNASRDLFDAYHLLTNNFCNINTLRKLFIAYGAMNRKDWRTIELNNISFNQVELKNKLIPVLRNSAAKQMQSSKDFANKLTRGCVEVLNNLLPFNDNEKIFFDKLIDGGEIRPELFSKDLELNNKLIVHPALLRKAGSNRLLT